jgi:hypothetical protein
MSEFDGARVGASLPALGYARALGRWQRAFDAANETDPYLALSECLDWAHTLDEVIARGWEPRGAKPKRPWWGWRQDPALGGGARLDDTMLGLRYVRNRVHHHLADALEPIHSRTGRINFPEETFQTFIWRDPDELPKGREEADARDAYLRALAGSEVQYALGTMAETFVFIGSLLDPPRPRPRAPIVMTVSP